MSDTTSEDTFPNAVSFLVSMANIATTVFLSRMLYLWLLVPAFPSLPALNYWQTYGILLATRFFAQRPLISDPKDTAHTRAVRSLALFFSLWGLFGLAFLVKSLAN